MLKPARQNDKELSKRATAILRKHGISRAAYIRSALEAVINQQAGKLQSILEATKSPASPKQRGTNISALQQRYRQIMGEDYQPLTEEEKKAFSDELSGGL